MPWLLSIQGRRSTTVVDTSPEREKVRQSGSGAESRARALRADQGLYTRNKRAIVSQRGLEYAKEWQ